MRRSLLEIRLLFMIQILEERAYLTGTIFITTLMPILLVYGFGSIGSGQTREGLMYVITGSTTLSLTLVGFTVVAQTIAQMKERGEFLYYASLPIARGNLIIAILAAKMLMQLPGTLAALLVGSWIYGFPIAASPLLLVVIPLTALSLVGVGAAAGLLAPSAPSVNVLSQMVTFFVMFAAPVLIPFERLPGVLQWIGMLLPPTYAADALRRVVSGEIDWRLALDLGILAGLSVVSILGVTRGMQWRLR